MARKIILSAILASLKNMAYPRTSLPQVSHVYLPCYLNYRVYIPPQYSLSTLIMLDDVIVVVVSALSKFDDVTPAMNVSRD